MRQRKSRRNALEASAPRPPFPADPQYWMPEERGVPIPDYRFKFIVTFKQLAHFASFWK